MYGHYSSSLIDLNKCILTFCRFLSHPGVRFFEVDTWVFLLAAFAVFAAFYACTTAKKRFVELLMPKSYSDAAQGIDEIVVHASDM